MKWLPYLTLLIVACVGAFMVGRLDRLGIEQPKSGLEETVAQKSSINEDSAEAKNSGTLVEENLSLKVANQALEIELTALRKEFDRLKVRNEILLGSRSVLAQIGFSSGANRLPKFTEETYRFLQLETEDEKRLRAVCDERVADLLAWELESAQNIQSNENSVMVEFPPMPQDQIERNRQLLDVIRTIIGAEDYELIEKSWKQTFESYLQGRKITFSLLKEGDRAEGSFMIETFDEEGNVRGRSISTGRPEVPERYKHIFGDNL